MAIEDDEKLNIKKLGEKSLLGFWHANTIIKKIREKLCHSNS